MDPNPKPKQTLSQQTKELEGIVASRLENLKRKRSRGGCGGGTIQNNNADGPAMSGSSAGGSGGGGGGGGAKDKQLLAQQKKKKKAEKGRAGDGGGEGQSNKKRKGAASKDSKRYGWMSYTTYVRFFVAFFYQIILCVFVCRNPPDLEGPVFFRRCYGSDRHSIHSCNLSSVCEEAIRMIYSSLLRTSSVADIYRFRRRARAMLSHQTFPNVFVSFVLKILPGAPCLRSMPQGPAWATRTPKAGDKVNPASIYDLVFDFAVLSTSSTPGPGRGGERDCEAAQKTPNLVFRICSV